MYIVTGQIPYRSFVALGEPCFESRSEEHTSELQSQSNLVCRLLLEKKKKIHIQFTVTFPPCDRIVLITVFLFMAPNLPLSSVLPRVQFLPTFYVALIVIIVSTFRIP